MALKMMKATINFVLGGLFLGLLISSCGTSTSNEDNDDGIEIHHIGNRTGDKLPIMGFPKTIEKEVDGKIVEEEVEYSVSDFKFMDQDSAIITAATFDGKIYVTDFFFTTCPTICSSMKRQMVRLHDKFEKEKDLVFLSHSIDTRTDTVPHLKKYAEDLMVKSEKWHFVTGERTEIKRMAKQYMVADIVESEDAPGGYEHSGHFVLVDKKKRIRSFCDGTDKESVDKFMKDIALLLKEKE